MHRLFFVAALFFHFHCSGQNSIDESKRDSLARSIERSQKAQRAWQDSFSKRQDSIYLSAQKTAAKPANGKNKLDQDVQKTNREEGRIKQVYVLAIAGLLFFVLLVALLFRKRKDKSHLQ
jgi:hypothetical protein